MVFPASERKTATWLRNTSATGELLGADLSKVKDMALHRAADKLLHHQDEIESHLFDTAQDLLDFMPSVTLYDLSNTYVSLIVYYYGIGDDWSGINDI